MKTSYLFFIALFLFIACSKPSRNENPTGSVPTVTTDSISAITSNSAIVQGNVVITDTNSVISRGICFKTSPGASIADSKVINGSGTGNFSTTLSGLSPNTTYYVRAFATNAKGTGYGQEKALKTTVIDSATVIYSLAFNKLYCMNASNGQVYWSRSIVNTTYSSAVYSKGKVYFGCTDGKLYCYDSTGTFLWTANTFDTFIPGSSGIDAQTPVIKNGLVYMVNGMGSLYAFDASSGSRIWHTEVASNTGTSTNPIVVDQTLFINGDSTLALNALTGARIWAKPIRSYVNPLYFGAKLYINDETGSLQILDPLTGLVILKKTNTAMFLSAMTMNISGNIIYTLTPDRITAADATTGLDKWLYMISTTKSTNSFRGGPGLVIDDTSVYVPDDYSIVKLNKNTGQVYKIIGFCDSAPGSITMVNGVFYMGIFWYNGCAQSGRFLAINGGGNMNTIWQSAFTDGFNIGTPCVVTKSGKVHSFAAVYDQ